ncbi:MAG: UvrD-helicase domain-containing protein, partial [Planctomycetota bacterium]
MQTQSGELDGDESILEGLTEPQRRAARHPGGPLLVLAGAGSGKTRVITHRVAYLASAGVDSDRIMAITFTNKAADEMRRRVEAMAGERVFVSTFHSFCAQLLRREIDEMGRESTFSIYDRSDSQSAVRRVIKDLDLEPKVYSPSDMLSRISRLKNDLVDPDEWREEAVGIKDRKLADIYEGYQEVLRENNALDFDDLLVEAVRLFREHPEVLRRYQERCEHLLVDEYQDTNLPQHLIARALQGKHKNITAVGDPDQMIYSWRGARLENILEFENDFPDSTIIKLERNYRSTSNILKAASVCIRNNLRRQDKTLWTDREDGEPVQLRELENSYREGDFVAGKVKEFIDAGVDPGEIAVFYRTKHQSLPLEHGFSSLAIPHQVVDSVGFFDRKAVKDIRAYLQLLLNPDDDEACRRIINTPSRGIGDKTLERLSNAAARRDLSLARAACRVHELDLPTRATKAVAGFAELYKELNSTEYDSVTALIEDIMNKTEYV